MDDNSIADSYADRFKSRSMLHVHRYQSTPTNILHTVEGYNDEWTISYSTDLLNLFHSHNIEV